VGGGEGTVQTDQHNRDLKSIPNASIYIMLQEAHETLQPIKRHAFENSFKNRMNIKSMQN